MDGEENEDGDEEENEDGEENGDGDEEEDDFRLPIDLAREDPLKRLPTSSFDIRT